MPAFSLDSREWPRAGTTVRSAVCGLRVRGAYSTLNLKNAALSSGVNSRQMVPSTTETESGFRVRGAKVLRSVDSKRLNFICTLPALFKPMV